MIKLIDDLSLLERLSEKEPYFGSLFNAAAVSFMDDPELLSNLSHCSLLFAQSARMLILS